MAGMKTIIVKLYNYLGEYVNLGGSKALCVTSLVSVFHTPEMLCSLSLSWKHRT